MTIRKVIAGVAGVVLAGMLGSGAFAESPAKHKGLYVSGAVGANWGRDADFSEPNIGSGDLEFDLDWAWNVAVGYAFGNGLRFEGELAHRRSDVDGVDIGGVAASGQVKVDSLMANLVYDFDVSRSFIPYLGLGAGLAVVQHDRVNALGVTIDDEDNVFAWQAIAGFAVPLTDGLDLTVDYRYFDTADVDLQSDGASPNGVDTEYSSHSAFIGLRYRFGAPKTQPRPRPATVVAPPLRPAPAPAPKPVAKPKPKPKPAPPPPPPPRSFIVFFDWDRSNIRPDAQRVIDAAVAYGKRRGFKSVSLSGHADRSGSARYNQGLSARRANAVKAAMVKLGMGAGSIKTSAFGEGAPLVTTKDGVREPRNRRVEINY